MEARRHARLGKAILILRWLVPLALVAGATAFWLISSGREPERPEAPPVPVRVMRPEYGDLVKTLKLNAHVESETMVTVVPLVSGILQELSVEVGQTVAAGQVVARIDAQRFELQLQQAEAAYLSAKSSYERVGQLYRANAATQQSYEQAKGQYEAYASQYELARIQLDYASVKSPIDGVVLVKHLSAGSIAAPERPLVTIGDLGDLVVRARVPERYYEAFGSPRESMRIAIRREGGDEYPGTIRSVSPFVSAETKNFEVVVSIGGSPELLRPGMFVAVEFELARWPGVYTLPYEALSGDGRLWWVDGGLARSRPFAPEAASDAAFAVPEEWAARDVIVEGQYFASEGSPVTVVAKREADR
ncbi:MAG TPA: efflux RND transporter periplasmic adaptor subunit [Spirochaetia bacterium]|nr:efflux RND transporter periplasmic adaptor subunit [Spirochaetales bacterium]HRW24560.1 efflux RND transporter periplasmic adaptor subunit [Spirochaetia bacterium]